MKRQETMRGRNAQNRTEHRGVERKYSWVVAGQEKAALNGRRRGERDGG